MLSIVLPYRIQGITVDLWGTLFFDSHYIDNLNFERALLLQKVFENVHYDFNTTPQIVLNKERKKLEKDVWRVIDIENFNKLIYKQWNYSINQLKIKNVIRKIIIQLKKPTIKLNNV